MADNVDNRVTGETPSFVGVKLFNDPSFESDMTSPSNAAPTHAFDLTDSPYPTEDDPRYYGNGG